MARLKTRLCGFNSQPHFSLSDSEPSFFGLHTSCEESLGNNPVVNPVVNYRIWYTVLYMARRKLGDQNIRSLSKISNGSSYAVTLPIAVVRRWKWKNRQKLQLTIDDRKKRIIIEDWRG
jgi:hypothetical protein